MARIIAIANPKGGVGKTDIAVNLSSLLAAQSKKVLLVDLSPQADASFTLGIKNENNALKHLLLEKFDSQKDIKETKYFNFDIVPSSQDIVSLEKALWQKKNGRFALKNNLRKIDKIYDFIIIDTPPSFSILALNALLASQEVIIPIQCEYLALKGAKDLLYFIKNSKPKITLKQIYALLTMYNQRGRNSRRIAKFVRETFPGRVFNVAIPKSIILNQAQQLRMPVIKYAPNSKAARAYQEIAAEIIGSFS